MNTNNIITPTFKRNTLYINKHVNKLTKNHPTNYTGYEFVSVIQTNTRVDSQRKTNTRIGIIYDVVGKSKANGSVLIVDLDRIQYSHIDEEVLIEHINTWYHTNRSTPLHIYLAIQGFDDLTGILQTIRITDITNILGKFFSSTQCESKITRRKRKKPLGDQICKS